MVRKPPYCQAGCIVEQAGIQIAMYTMFGTLRAHNFFYGQTLQMYGLL